VISGADEAILHAKRKSLSRAAGAALCCLFLTDFAGRPAWADPVEVPPPAVQGQNSQVPIAGYQAKLQALDQLVAACQRAMTPANCQGERVGPDIEVSIPSGKRQVRLAWLRTLLDHAGKEQAGTDVEKKASTSVKPQPDESRPAAPSSKAPVVPQAGAHGPRFKPPTLSQQLVDARSRLATDIQFAEQLKTQPKAAALGSANSASSNLPRQTIARILAAREYHPAVVGPTLMQRALEKVGNWIDGIVGALRRAGFRSKWIGRGAEIVFLLLLCIALAWFLIRLERQGRLRSGLLPPGTGVDSPSARDWQLWLEDASKAATQGAWRDAIHLLYWASISRLESNGAWSADRARTPREYLALVAADSTQRTRLAALTRNFERTWYGGRPAAEADFRDAEELAAQLGVGSSTGQLPPGKRAR
jgi:Domain of unknown function (DUF4129)